MKKKKKSSRARSGRVTRKSSSPPRRPTGDVSTPAPPHTPGPWMVEPCSDDFDGAISVVSQYSRVGEQRTANWIAECDLQDDRVEENHANARLIAAAPELLAALKQLMKAYESVLPGLAKIAVQDYKLINDAPVAAERAIAKAEGR